MFLARKITRAKWCPKAGLDNGAIPADAVTVDLRTRANTLSFWRCGEADEEALKMVALTLAAASERVDKVELVWLDGDDLIRDKIDLAPSRGRTPVATMVDQHVDAKRLDLLRLGCVARRVADALHAKRYKRWTKAQVLDILIAAVEEKLVDLDGLGEKVQNDVRAAVEKRRGEAGR